jgi:glycosyltransferase involved in cell wall biosynthesis
MPSLREQLGPHRGGADHELIDDEGGLAAGAMRVEPTAADRAAEDAAPGQAAVLPVGVVYHGDWRKHADGMARHVREQALALATRLPVNLRGTSWNNLLDHELESDVISAVGHLPRVSFTHTLCAIRQGVFNNVEHLRNLLCPPAARMSGMVAAEAVYQSTIVYTSWERDQMAGALIRELNKVARVWVPCEMNRAVLQASGLKTPMLVMPYPYDPTTHLTTALCGPRANEVAPTGKRFYNINKWEPRKGQDALLGAFLCAFRPQERACLTLKTYGWGDWKEYPTPVESLQKWVTDPAVIANGWTRQSLARLVRIETDRISDREIAELHARNNIYVSASHGEAWDLAAFDARCIGNSLVWVDFGGPTEYTPDEPPRFVRIEPELEPVHPGYRWEPGAQWAGYTQQQLMQALRRCEPPTERWHPSDFPGRFGRYPVGQRMADEVLAVVAARNPKAAAELARVGSYG